MAEHNPKKWIDNLRQEASRFIQSRETRAKRLADIAVKNNWEVFVFGGVPRGFAGYGRNDIRDLDLVFEDSSFEEFLSVFSDSLVRKTRFGGAHLLIDNLEVDAWPLSATWAFRENLVPGATFENLPRTTFLNFDGIVVQFATLRGRSRRVYADGFERFLRTQILDFELSENPFPELCVVRSLRLAWRHGLPLSSRLARWCFEVLNTGDDSRFIEVQQIHYATVEFDKQRLSYIKSKLDCHLETCPLLEFNLVTA